MLNDFISRFNWVDIFVLIIIFRIGYVAMSTGIRTEVFKFCGVICAIYLSSHYYTALSDFFAQLVPGSIIPLKFLDFLSLILLLIIGYLIFVLVRSICRTFVKLDSPSIINRWMGLALGIFRGYLISGIVIFTMVICGVTYFKNSSARSYFGKQLLEVQPGVYTWLWNNIGSNLIASEKLNPVVGEVKGENK
jgi:uncharacterized membrane protein required for colicin V production